MYPAVELFGGFWDFQKIFLAWIMVHVNPTVGPPVGSRSFPFRSPSVVWPEAHTGYSYSASSAIFYPCITVAAVMLSFVLGFL